MSNFEAFNNLKANQHPNNKRKTTSRFSSIVKEIIAIFFWIYVITKLFVFDIDIFLVGIISPSFMWLLSYKFFILIGLLSLILLVTKNRYVLSWSLYIFFYPLILFLWKIPYFVLKNKSWNFAFLFIDSLIYFFKSFKLNIITTSIYLISIAIILILSNKLLLWICIVALIVILFIAYIQRFILVFKPSSVFKIYSNFFSKIGNSLSTHPAFESDENITKLSIESMDEKQIQKWTDNVNQLVLLNRICLLVAKELKSYQVTRFNIISYVFIILILVLHTVLSFSVINFGLYKINQTYFSFTIMPTFFNFFYYSFNIILFNPIQEIIATTPISQVVLMIESFCSLIIGAILISLFLSVKSERDIEDLNIVIKNLTGVGTRVEDFIKDEYKLNIEEAMQALKKFNTSLVDFFYKITDAIK